MNKLTIIGNLTRDPQLRTVNGQNGPISVCDFTVAVNRRQRNGQNEADYFRVTAWRGLADSSRRVFAQHLWKRPYSSFWLCSIRGFSS